MTEAGLKKKKKKLTKKDHMVRRVPAFTPSCIISCLRQSSKKSVTTPRAPGALEWALFILRGKEPFHPLYGCCMGRTSQFADQCLPSALILFSAPFELFWTTCSFNGPGHS